MNGWCPNVNWFGGLNGGAYGAYGADGGAALDPTVTIDRPHNIEDRHRQVYSVLGIIKSFLAAFKDTPRTLGSQPHPPPAGY